MIEGKDQFSRNAGLLACHNNERGVRLALDNPEIDLEDG